MPEDGGARELLQQAAARLDGLKAAGHADAAALVRQVSGLLKLHSLSVVVLTMELAPLAYARGESRLELLDMGHRYRAHRPYNAFIRLDPRAEWPVDVSSTGQYGPGRERMLRPS